MGRIPTLSRAAGLIAHWTGLIYLSAFVLNTGLLWFFVRKSINCNFIDAGVIYVQCGDSAFERFLDFFLLYFSPLVAPVTALYWRYLFHMPENLTQEMFTYLFLYFLASVFVITSCLLVLRRMIRGFILHKQDKARMRKSLIMLMIIILPAFIGFGYRLYLSPPEWVTKNVEVDIWNGRFVVPREELKDWSLVTLPRPDKKPNEYEGKLTRWWRSVPYLTFKYSIKGEIGERNLDININPHYNALDKQAMENLRQKLAGYKTKLKSEIDAAPVYRATPRRLGPWQIYDAGIFREDVFPDIYVARNDDGTIGHILQCTPSHACAVKTRFAWATYPCGNDFDCESCQKICTDISQGVADYDIRYSFYKSDLEKYFTFNKEIQAHINSFYTSKNKTAE